MNEDEKDLLDPVDIDLSDDNTVPNNIDPDVSVPELFEEVKEVEAREKELKEKEEGVWKVPTMDDYIEGTQDPGCGKCHGRGFTGYKLMPYGTKVKKPSKKARKKGKKEKIVPAYMRFRMPCECMEKNPEAEIWKDEFKDKKESTSSISKSQDS